MFHYARRWSGLCAWQAQWRRSGLTLLRAHVHGSVLWWILPSLGPAWGRWWCQGISSPESVGDSLLGTVYGRKGYEITHKHIHASVQWSPNSVGSGSGLLSWHSPKHEQDPEPSSEPLLWIKVSAKEENVNRLTYVNVSFKWDKYHIILRVHHNEYISMLK